MLQDGQEILEGRFQIIKKLGSGAFGEIYKGKCPPPNHSLTHKTMIIREWLKTLSFMSVHCFVVVIDRVLFSISYRA